MGKKQTRGETQAREKSGGLTARQSSLSRWCSWARWWLFPDNKCPFTCEGITTAPANHLPSSVLLLTVLSGASRSDGPAPQAEHSNCQEPAGWNAKPLWCFKHDTAAGRGCTGLRLFNTWQLSMQLIWKKCKKKKVIKYWISSCCVESNLC